MTTLKPSVALLQGSAETWHIRHSDFAHSLWDQFCKSSSGDKTGGNDLRGTLIDLGGKQCLSEEQRPSATLGGAFFSCWFAAGSLLIMSYSKILVLDPS